MKGGREGEGGEGGEEREEVKGREWSVKVNVCRWRTSEGRTEKLREQGDSSQYFTLPLSFPHSLFPPTTELLISFTGSSFTVSEDERIFTLEVTKSGVTTSDIRVTINFTDITAVGAYMELSSHGSNISIHSTVCWKSNDT